MSEGMIREIILTYYGARCLYFNNDVRLRNAIQMGSAANRFPIAAGSIVDPRNVGYPARTALSAATRGPRWFAACKFVWVTTPHTFFLDPPRDPRGLTENEMEKETRAEWRRVRHAGTKAALWSRVCVRARALLRRRSLASDAAPRSRTFT